MESNNQMLFPTQKEKQEYDKKYDAINLDE